MHIASETSLEFLFKSNYNRLVYFSYQLVGEKDAAEDIVQDVFIKYWNQPEDIKNTITNVKSFLYTAVKNESLNVLRHQKVTNTYKETVTVNEVEEASIVNSIIRAEVIAELHTAIESLPASCQRIARLSFLEEKKNQEIAEELGVSINTVKTQKQRGLQLLRLRLNPEIFTTILLLGLLD